MSEAEIFDSGNPVACAILHAGRRIAGALDRLGTSNAATEMGAIEFLAVHLGEKIDALADAVIEASEK